MKRELKILIIIVIAVLILFISGVLVTEKININNIRENYLSIQQQPDNRIAVIPAVSEKAVNFHKTRVLVFIFRTLLSFLIPSLFLFSGLSARLRSWANGKTRNMAVVLALFFVVYSITDYLLNLPLDFYGGFVRLHEYGLSNQAPLKWIEDSLINFTLNTLAGALFIWVPYLLIKKFPGRWWLITGLLSFPVIAFLSFISPLYIDPLYNKFQPLEDRTLNAEIQKQLIKTGISNCNVYQVNKSMDTNTMNAYMTGFFSTRRIVIWDTTIKKMTVREVLCISAHEIGHYKFGHIWKTVLLDGMLSIILLYLVNISSLWILKKSGGIFRFGILYDAASIPLLILTVSIFMFAAAPAANSYSRLIERQADRFELDLTRDNTASASATIKLYEGSLTLPKPGIIYKLWVYDHPTFEERIDFANSYKPREVH